MAISKFLDPKNDFAFKKIFGNEKNKSILISFLNDILGFRKGEKIKEVTFLNNILDPDTQAKKQSIVDVLCVDEKGTQYIVEMQVARYSGFEKRAQYYAAKAYVNQMREGEAYHNLKEIIFLAITDFEMFPDKTVYQSNHIILDQDSHDHDLKDFSFCFLELPKFTKTIDELETTVDKWMYFFKHAPETTMAELQEAIGENTAIRDAYHVLDRYYWTDKEINTYEQMKKIDLDNKVVLEAALDRKFDEGKAEGLAEGEKAKKDTLRAIARELLARGISMNEITVMTGLTEEEIKM